MGTTDRARCAKGGRDVIVRQEERMSERQMSLFQEIPVEEDLGGVVGDGLGPDEEAYEGELEELFF